MRMLLAVPTRGRPANVDRLLLAMEETCCGEVDVVLGVDADDPCLRDYLGFLRPGVAIDVRPDLRHVVPWLNELVMPRVDSYSIVGHLGDDNVPVTKGWDVRLMEALQQKPFAFPNDLYPREPGSLACHIFMRSEIVRALGFFGQPRFKHMCVDAAWTAWGQACGIAYLDDVIVEHRHFSSGGAAIDDTYRRSSALMDEDREAWRIYQEDPEGLTKDITTIRGAL